MNAETKLAELANLGGVLPQYTDMQGHVHVTTAETQRALLNAVGIAAGDDAQVDQSLADLRNYSRQRQFPQEVIVESGTAIALEFAGGAAWTLHADDGGAEIASATAGAAIELPSLPSGVYELSVTMGGQTEVIRILAAPRRLASVEALTGTTRVWGINLALYGLCSARNAGLGDFRDLENTAALAGRSGAAFVGVNPIHSMGFSDLSISPYSPSHRGFLNTAHIALDAVPGLEGSQKARQILAQEAALIEQFSASEDVLYLAHKKMAQRVLNDLFAVFAEDAPENIRTQCETYIATAGHELERFAAYETHSEKHGSDWRDWPEGPLARPDPARLRFHMWLQWVANTQLHATQSGAKASGLKLGLYLDLAVGPRRNGAESWCEKSCIAQGVSIGAPPDHLSPEGQNWDLSAFAPRKLQQANYRPLRRILAQIMRHAGVVRIDHVLGLARSFLIPDNGAPGGYIAQPLESLIAIIKIEAERHRCAVIGEDLGLVPDNFRDVMRSHGFYGYSVLQYEKDHDGEFHDPAQGSAQVLCCFATHDTPTVKGYETGCDINWWQRLGWIDAEQARLARTKRAKEVAALTRIAGSHETFQSSVHAILAGSNASMVSLQLDDILGVTEAQNLPGTIDQHPNWRRKYDVRIEELATDDRLSNLAFTMDRTRPIPKKEKVHDVPSH
ncbi:MAG: 4-alpha-glucanotransferase [Sulfitobacter sp.]